MVSRSSSSAISSAVAGTSATLVPSVTLVEVGQEPLELRTQLLAGGQLALLGQWEALVLVGPVEGVVLLLETGHHVADLRGLLHLAGDVLGTLGGAGVQRGEVPGQAGRGGRRLQQRDRGLRVVELG